MKKISVLLILVMLCLCAAPVSPAFAAGGDLDLGDPEFSTATKYTFSELDVNTTKTINTVMINVDSGSIDMPAITGAKVYKDLVDRTFTIVYDTPQDPAAMQTFLRSLPFNCDPDTTQHVAVEFNSAVTSGIPDDATVTALKIGDDMHYYICVVNRNANGNPQVLTWNQAYNKAKDMWLMGNRGYLMTITSAEEDALADSINSTHAWAGGIRNKDIKDADQLSSMPPQQGGVNDFYWACGPEAGDNFSSYSNWYPGNPSNSGGIEYVLCVHFGDIKKWNDCPYNHGIMTNYFVEFGGYPTDDPHNPGNTNVVAEDETDITPPSKTAKDLIDEAAEKAKKKIDALDDLTDADKDFFKDMIDDEAQDQKDKIAASTSIPDIEDIVNDAKENMSDIVDESIAGNFLMKYNIDPTTKQPIRTTDDITPENAPGIVAGKAAWDKLTPKQKAYANGFLGTSTWPELYRYAYDLITPKTGDSTNMPLIALLMLVSLTGLAAATLAKRRFN